MTLSPHIVYFNLVNGKTRYMTIMHLKFGVSGAIIDFVVKSMT